LTTTAVAAELAVLEPKVFEPVTATRTVVPESPAPSTYVCDVAPAILVQLAPVWSQLRHWYV
jgi:hypothetical protein